MTLPLLDEEETPQEPVYPYPTYEGEDLNVLLSSPEWSSSDSILSSLQFNVLSQTL